MNNILNFQDVSFGYTKKENVLESVSFSLRDSAVTALLGVNGAGKSTITWLAANMLIPNGGSITLFGNPVEWWNKTMRKGIGLLSYIDPLFEFFTINEHLEYVGRLYRVDRSLLKKRIDNLKSVFDLGEFDGKRINTLSTGNRRKLGIITTLIHSPRLVIWDEPFNGLDSIATVRLKELVQKLKASGTTVLMTSQVLEPVEAVCDRVILLNGKKIVFDENLSDLSVLLKKHNTLSLEGLLYKIGTAGKPLTGIDWL